MRTLHNPSPLVIVRLIVFALALMLTQSCSKDELLTATGVVINTGTFASGGCEWIIKSGADQYQPNNLPVDFQIDSLPVEITFRIVHTPADCPNPQNYSGLIHLNRIKRI